ncbi:glutathione synthetase, chloroplastic-like isoform X2 [Mangifera indica]|uniref:glutathione synthetase, chloroplastic-like isoform X2 n=1 Tax=Mangifera indica TaxID=29780 RepID=UPI001CFC44F6|nr:glutathione synthetase, chloroplastic-like isoform X2 [Mangifera indica]XP_044500726.1 glutathione synthetase, chloroplastic-like isoform X2 [Mangifera indica]XP_044500727.1 glutathione synthetase, chloroplastic-like isoform X2 [Mangifera indica]
MMLLFGALFMALLLETKTCRSLLIHYGEHLGLDSKKIPDKSSVSQFAEAMVKAWTEYNNSRAVVMVVFQSEDCKLYDQHWLCSVLKEKYNITTIQKTLAEIDVQGKLLPDGTLLVFVIAVVANQFHLSILELVMHQLIILQNQNGEPGYVWSSLLL